MAQHTVQGEGGLSMAGRSSLGRVHHCDRLRTVQTQHTKRHARHRKLRIRGADWPASARGAGIRRDCVGGSRGCRCQSRPSRSAHPALFIVCGGDSERGCGAFGESLAGMGAPKGTAEIRRESAGAAVANDAAVGAIFELKGVRFRTTRVILS